MIDEKAIENNLKNENLSLAAINKRAMAFMVDDLIISAIFIIMFWEKLHALGSPDAVMRYVNSLFLYIIAVKTIYQTVFIALYGQTLGKMLVKIRVINADYLDAPDWLEALQRAASRSLSEVVFYLGFLWANFTPLRQTLHDKYAKTLVVDA